MKVRFLKDWCGFATGDVAEALTPAVCDVLLSRGVVAECAAVEPAAERAVQKPPRKRVKRSK